MNGVLKSIMENTVFFLEFVGVVVAMFLVAYILEKLIQKKRGSKERILNTRKVAMIGMFSAIAMILMLFEFPLPFAPPFYEIDFSELPIMVGTFAFGPVAGVMMEFCKVLLKLAFKGTSTAFVGDLANFIIGCSLILPASAVYEFIKAKKGAIIGLIVGTLTMTIFGSMFNALYLLPTFSVLYGMPLDALIGMGTKINPAITNITTFVCFAVAPFNLLKAGIVSIVTLIVYKPLSPIIKGGRETLRETKPVKATEE